jgi:hypothetical protein
MPEGTQPRRQPPTPLETHPYLPPEAAVEADGERPADANAAPPARRSARHPPSTQPVAPEASWPEPDIVPATDTGPDDEPADPHAPAAVAADWCGLLYLVNIAQRLDFPERLWQAGVDEGAALAGMLHVLGGDDPATRILSPVFPGPPPQLAPLADWAHEELTEGLTAAAAALLSRSLDRRELEARIAAIAAWFGGDAFAAKGFATWAAACHLAVFETMTGEALAPGALVERFGRSGLIEVDGDTIRIVQPLDAIDTDVRRAGLDADPGWLAWLGKSLIFVFEDGAS